LDAGINFPGKGEVEGRMTIGSGGSLT
jgi:hypothetical protein